MPQEIYSDLTEIRKDPSRDRVTCLRPRQALVLGGADCVWNDVLAFEHLLGHPWDGLVLAANDIGCHWPRDLDHWVSLHTENMPRWVALRTEYGFSHGYRIWGRRKTHTMLEDFIVYAWGGGSSGMFATQIALELGCTHAVLCGIPMTQTPHFRETKERFHAYWIAANAHWKPWGENREKFGDRVRSMSGRTLEMFGYPTTAWLEMEIPPYDYKGAHEPY